MTDLFDLASDRELADRELLISLARAKNKVIKFTGKCLYCNEEINAGRFCPGGECKEDHEREQKMKEISGSK